MQYRPASAKAAVVVAGRYRSLKILSLDYKNIDKMKNYDYYNREERAICSHLFRLLHENLYQHFNSPLGAFIKLLFQDGIRFKNGNKSISDLKFENVGIYTEVALIRDAYQNAKPNVNEFMDKLVELVMKQKSINNCRLYSNLKNPLGNPERTHPKQIRQKATALNIKLSPEELSVYESIQGMFNAKPDLVISIDNILLVCEAKHTQKFDKNQIQRTEKIAEVWTNLLFKDLGFDNRPIYSVFKLGAKKFNPNINWEQISKIADETYPETDRTRICIKLKILKKP
jgi:hypothetical protein